MKYVRYANGVLVALLLTLNIFHTFVVSIVNFEHVIAGWVVDFCSFHQLLHLQAYRNGLKLWILNVKISKVKGNQIFHVWMKQSNRMLPKIFAGQNLRVTQCFTRWFNQKKAWRVVFKIWVRDRLTQSFYHGLRPFLVESSFMVTRVLILNAGCGNYVIISHKIFCLSKSCNF